MNTPTYENANRLRNKIKTLEEQQGKINKILCSFKNQDDTILVRIQVPNEWAGSPTEISVSNKDFISFLENLSIKNQLDINKNEKEFENL